MYAVIETGGKQYRVEVGTELEVELLDIEPGQSVILERVLLVADGDETSVGQPVVANAAVEAEVVRRSRGAKIIVFKYRPKARSRVKKGHRQDHTILRITDVRLNGKSDAEARRKVDDSARTERQRLQEAAARQAAADAALAAKLAEQTETSAPKAGRGSRRAGAAAAPATEKPRRSGTKTRTPAEGPVDAEAASGTSAEPLESGPEPTATAGEIGHTGEASEAAGTAAPARDRKPKAQKRRPEEDG